MSNKAHCFWILEPKAKNVYAKKDENKNATPLAHTPESTRRICEGCKNKIDT